MTTTPSLTPRKKKLRLYQWIGGLFLLLFVLFLFQLFGPSPKIIVSPQTTYITDPLRPDGLPDYGRYLLESSREGVTPENNGAALLWRTMWPGKIDVKDQSAFAAELGITDDLANDHPLQPFYNAKNRERVAVWLNQQGRLVLPGQTVDPATIEQMLHYSSSSQQNILDTSPLGQLLDVVDAVLDRASMSPWTSKEFPPLASWVEENQAPLDLLVEASKRSHFYAPSPALLAGESSLLAAQPWQNGFTYREVARSLPVRAMWHAGEGRPKEAWQDLLAVHRISNLCAGNTLVEYLLAVAIREIACEQTCTLLGDTKLSSADARQILRDLSALPRLPPLANCVDHGERLFALDLVLSMASEGGGVLAMSDTPGHSTPNALLNHVVIDWNIVLTEINFWFDRITAALQTSDPVARAAALNQVFADMEQVRTEMWSPSKLVMSVISRRQRSCLAATNFVGLLTSSLQTVATAENRTNSTLDLTRLAAALAVDRAEHASYPSKLSELVPSILDKLPTDDYYANPYLYQRTDDGYLLYSCGENGVDDGGNNKSWNIFEGRTVNDLQKLKPAVFPDIHEAADDLSIRVPRLLPPVSSPLPPASDR